MTQDEIIEMARQAGFTVGYGSPALPKHEAFAKLVRNHYSYTHAHLWLTRIEGAVKAEREACALIAETPISGEQDDITMEAKDRVAKAIRARGEA